MKAYSIDSLFASASRLLLAAFIATAAPALAQTMTGGDPVKIFILAGESNMHGKGTVSPATTPGTLDHLYANDTTGRYAFLKSGGTYVTRADVGIRGLVYSGAPNPGNLTTGYGGNAAGLIGPELGFGHILGDAYENKVLIVKVGVDGTTLGGSFCPPSSRIGDPEPVTSADKGFYYKEIIRLVNEAKTSLGATPYEIAGLGWHQGWNDRVNPAYSAAYEVNMANFINDIRTDLATPNMPVVIASAAMDPNYTYSEVERAQLKMTDATAYPAYAGNVAVVDTRLPYNGLEFWQNVALSPADEGYHWNRSGKTYLHIGMAMGDAMSLIASNRIPFRMRAIGGSGGVTLSWKNGTETPSSVRVLRNGVEIAAAAPANPPSFVDPTAPLGVNNYELQFTMPVSPCPPLVMSHNSGITDLKGNQRVNGVKLTWSNNLAYTGIKVKRNGSVLAASIAGTATSYTDFSPLAGSVTYSVEPVDVGSTPAEVQVNVSAGPAGGAIIYEPFDMTADTTLDGKNGGIGLDGRWSAGSAVQVTSSNLYTFGSPTPLPVFGNRIIRTAANGSCSTNIGSVLADAGLMADGAQLWFSFLCQNPDSVNCHPTIALGNDVVTYFNTAANSASAIGARLYQGNKIQGMILSGGVQAGATATQATLGTSEVVLVVGRITWGANASAPDTIDIYTPGPDLVLDSPQSVSAVVDQSTFNVLSMWGNGPAPNMDEIRFGASYEAVIGQAADTSGDFTAPTPATMSFATPPTAISTSAITMTAATATDTNGVQYRFLETSGNPGGTSSAWQDSATYTDTGLTPGTQYTYTVQARDKSVNNNTNTVSSPAPATTFPPDLTPPPTPGFDTAPNATSFSTITMTAITVADPEGGAVEYYFTETSGNPGGNSSGWQSSPTYTDTGLNPNTQYTYTVKARDTASPPNESAPSAPASATTPVKTPTTYIRQNNTSLLNTTGAWNVGDLPLGVDSVQWDATCAGNRSTALGGDVTWGKIIIATGTAGAVTIGNTSGAKISLNGVGGIGIDMSAAPQDLTINNLITLGSSQTWNVTTSRTITVGNYAIGDGGSGYGITKAGAGTLVLQGSNTYSGPINITGGTVSINSIANGGAASPLGQSSSAASNLLLGNGTNLTYTGGAASSDRSFTINGTAAAHGATLNASGTGALHLSSTSPIAYGTPDQTRTLTLAGSNTTSTNVLAAQITNNGTGAVTLAKASTGNIWWLTNGTNSFTGGVQLNRGTLIFSSGALGITGPISITSNALALTLKWAADNTDDISSRWSNSSSNAAITTFDVGTNDVTFASNFNFTNNSGTYLAKAGSGKLTLNGVASTSVGPVQIREGTLAVTTLANGGANSAIGKSTSAASNLGLRGGALQYTGAGSTTDRNFHLTASSTIDASGTGALVFSQTGTISPTPAAKTGLTWSTGATSFTTGSTADLAVGMKVGGTGIPAGATITAIGNNNGFTISAPATSAATGTGVINFGSYSPGTPITLTLTGTHTGANEIKGALSDSISSIPGDTNTTVGITKTGVGKWVLSGANIYTGATTISGGTLALGANEVLPNASAIFLGAATLDAVTFTDTLGTLDVTAAATINLGTGAALAFANSNAMDWSGGTLNITGTLGPNSIRFGNDNTGLSVSQLALITVNGSGTYTLDANGYLVAGGGAPEIAVEQPAASNIPSGGSKDFGTVTTGSNNSLTFTIRNTGTANLNLTGTQLIAVSGTNAADFTVTAQPTTPVTSGDGTTTFTVQFAPSAAGARSGLLTIANNDSDEGTFTIQISGTGQTQYDAWAGGAAFDADANGDGVKNGMAFLLGATGPYSAVTLPTVTQGSGNLTLTFNMLKPAIRGSSSLSVEHSSNLGISDPWTPVLVTDMNSGPTSGVTFAVAPGGGSTNGVTATISSSEAASGKLFGRLKANP